MVRVAAARTAPVLGDVAGNRAATTAAIHAAADAGARLVVLPELATSGYAFADVAEARRAGEPVPGPSTAAWGAAAAARGVVVCGGICERDGERLRNTAVVLDADGRLAAVYRKLHLWGDETRLFVAGDEAPPVVATAAGRIGVGICYDLWFPELVRSLAHRGAEILAFPSNLSAGPAEPGLPHVDVIVALAAAHTSRVHLVVADRCGDERAARWLGAALVADADGRLVAPPPPGDAPALAVADVDPAAARDKRWGPSNDLLGDLRRDVL